MSDQLDYKLVTPAQSQVVQCVSHYVGFSLSNHGQELREFLARGVDNPQTIVDAHVSDCGLFALAVWHVVGVQDPRLAQKYQIGMAIEWLHSIAQLHNAIRHPSHDGPPSIGSLMEYFITGKNDNHVEFVIGRIIESPQGWMAPHAGGGRPDCAIRRGWSDVKWSDGRPLQRWYDINALIGGT